MSEQAIALWKAQIPTYERIISRCCSRVLTPLTHFLPPDFEDKIQQFRQLLSVRQPQSYENYIDVIVHHIEGKKNQSNILLADYFVQEFGGSLKYWQNVIFDVAQPVLYTNNLTVWHVRKIFDEKLYIDSENLSNYRRLCSLTKSYITAITNLIKYISKFDKKKDNIAKIDELFKKVKSAEEKYVSFSEKIDVFQKSMTFDELSHNISQKSKQNALKNFYHFNQPNKHGRNQKRNNTLFNYNFRMKSKQKDERVSEPTKNLRQVDKQLTNQRLNQFEKAIKNVKAKDQEVQQLRELFKRQKLNVNANTENYRPINYTTIHDNDYYFSYAGHPIELQSFSTYTKPFEKHQFVNYDIYSEDEYQDLIGEDVQNNTQISSVSELSKTSFVVSDGHLSDDQDLDRANKEMKPTVSSGFGDRWSFSRGNAGNFLSKIGNYAIILVQSKNKFPLQVRERNEVQQTLYRIVDGKDKASINQAISKEKIKISKAKLNQFLRKNCRAVKQNNPNRTIYKIHEHEEENNQQQQEKQNASCDYRPEVGDDNEKQDPEDTGFYSNQNFSDTFRMQTRQSKKQSSQRLTNSRLEDIGKRTRSRKSAQEGSQHNKKSI